MIAIEYWGLINYRAAWKAQEELRKKVVSHWVQTEEFIHLLQAVRVLWHLRQDEPDKE